MEKRRREEHTDLTAFAIKVKHQDVNGLFSQIDVAVHSVVICLLLK